MPKPRKEKLPATRPEEPTAVGRPTSYLPEFTEQTIKLCSLGATDVDLADFFDVSTRTINRWKVTHPEFVEAIRRGKDPADDRIENSLYHKAQDREVEEEQAIKLKTVTYGDNGKRLKEEERVEVVKVRKFIPGDTTAMIFWLKNRRSDQWRDVHKHEHGGAGAFDNLDDKELLDFITLEAQEIIQAQLPAPAPITIKPKKRTNGDGKLTH